MKKLIASIAATFALAGAAGATWAYAIPAHATSSHQQAGTSWLKSVHPDGLTWIK